MQYRFQLRNIAFTSVIIIVDFTSLVMTPVDNLTSDTRCPVTAVIKCNYLDVLTVGSLHLQAVAPSTYNYHIHGKLCTLNVIARNA